MNKNTNRVIMFVLVSLQFFGLHTPLHADNIVKSAAKRNKVPLFLYLNNASARIGCYYTVESIISDNGVTAYDNLTVVDESKIKTVPDLIAKFTRELPGITVMQDRHDPKIIHFIDYVLLKNRDYALENTGDFVYSGLLQDMPDSLGKHLNLKIETKHSFPMPLPIMDYKTFVKIDVYNQEVRSILTDAVPLAKYNHYLWTAETYQTQGRLKTYFFYCGYILTK